MEMFMHDILLLTKVLVYTFRTDEPINS